MTVHKKRLAIVITHPIQYYAPIFKMLAIHNEIAIHVFHSRVYDEAQFDEGFGQKVKWDIPLLDGYPFSFPPRGTKTSHLIKKIEKWEPETILVFGWNPKGHLTIMRFFKGKVPIWFRGDSTLLDEVSGLKKWLRRRFLTWVYKYIDKGLYVGQENKRYFEVHGLKSNQLFFVPHAIDNKRFFDDLNGKFEKEALAWRQELGIDSNSVVILFVGKLEAVKEPSLLLQAFLELDTKIAYNLHLVFVGTGNLEGKLKNQADNHPKVHFLGFVNQSRMPISYRLGNIFCLPSSSETWGLAVNEAMACGLTVVISDKVGCANDLVKNSDYGIIFQAGNIESCKKAILIIIDRLNQIPNLGTKAKKAVIPWSFESIIRAIENQIN